MRSSGARAPRRRSHACKAGETFETVAREVSEDGNKAQGGVIGMRPRRAPARRLRRRWCKPPEGGRGRADAAAHRRRLPCPQAGRASAKAARSRSSRRMPATSCCAPSAAAVAGGRGAPAGRVPPADRERAEDLRTARARELRGRQRRAGRRSRLGQPGHVRARVRRGDERAAAQRHLRAGRVAFRRAPDPGGRAPRRHARRQAAARAGAQRRCASRSSTRPTPNGSATCAARLRRDARARRSERRGETAP